MRAIAERALTLVLAGPAIRQVKEGVWSGQMDTPEPE